MKKAIILAAAAFLGLASCEKESDPNCYTGEIIQGGAGVVYDEEYNFVEEEILYIDNCSGDTLSFTVYDACDAHGWRVKGSVDGRTIEEWREDENISGCENDTWYLEIVKLELFDTFTRVTYRTYEGGIFTNDVHTLDFPYELGDRIFTR